jgi:hypothetical protein
MYDRPNRQHIQFATLSDETDLLLGTAHRPLDPGAAVSKVCIAGAVCQPKGCSETHHTHRNVKSVNYMYASDGTVLYTVYELRPPVLKKSTAVRPSATTKMGVHVHKAASDGEVCHE